MISLWEFFSLNRQIILFVYGLGFFILGFAILLQVRQSSRLDLARSLRWLAVFGIFHALNEWADLFIPLQEQYLSKTLVNLLWGLQLLFLGASFACLFEFGVAALRPLGRARWLHGFAGGLLVGWIFIIFFVLQPIIPDQTTWHRYASASARYFIGFPGGLLAAYGLRVHAVQRIKPLNVPAIYQMLRVAGFSLGIYAFLAGLIPPPIDYFPGNLLNTEIFLKTFGVPVLVFRSFISLVIAAAIIRALEIFEVETARRIESLEQQQIMTADHERLARELHDGAIQKVYTAGLLVESAARLGEPGSEVNTRLERSLVVLNDSIVELRRNLLELHSSTTPVTESLPKLLQRFTQNPHYNTLVNITLEISLPEDCTLSPMRSAHLMAIINEALSNIVRHAKASNVKIKVADLEGNLVVVIKDDGIGINPEARAGYGLSNMRDRARLLNGSLEFSGKSKRGTLVTLKIPWMDER